LDVSNIDVPKLEMLISADGRCVRSDSQEFLMELLGDPNPDYDATLFAVKNLGFVNFGRSGSLLQVAVHPRNVAWPAVDAMISIIGSSDAKLFTITYLSQLGWRQETTSSVRDACARLLELCPVGPSTRVAPRDRQ
jgi:hypothetical protein